MKQAVKTGLPAPGSPIEWATLADGILYTAQIPLKADGTIESGDIGTQTRLTLDNLKRTVTAAGGSLADVTQILVYLPDPKDFPGMNEVYGQYFTTPYPNRATVIAQLMVPGAHGHRDFAASGARIFSDARRAHGRADAGHGGVRHRGHALAIAGRRRDLLHARWQ